MQGLGITDANPQNEGTLTVPRLPGFDRAGQYDAIVHYSNDDIEGTHDYNPQVVDLGLQASEGGLDGLAGRTTFRYTYLATNFWEAVMPLKLRTDSGDVTFGNTRHTMYIDEGPTGSTADDTVLDGYAIAPDVDWIAFAPFVIATDGVEPAAPDAPAAPKAAVSGTSATITWEAPDDNGRPITSYRVEVWDAAAQAVASATPVRSVSVTEGLGASMSTTVAGLPVGSYVARVVAVNDLGDSAPSPASAPFTVAAGGGTNHGGGEPGAGTPGTGGATGTDGGWLATTGLATPIGLLTLLAAAAIALGAILRRRTRARRP